MDPTGAGGITAVPVISLNAFTLDMKRDRVDVTSFGDLFKQWVQGLPDIAGTLGGWWDSDAPEIFDVALGDVAAYLELIPSTLQPTFLFKGPAYLDASINTSATGAVAVTSTYVGAGDWTREPPGVVMMARAGEPLHVG